MKPNSISGHSSTHSTSGRAILIALAGALSYLTLLGGKPQLPTWSFGAPTSTAEAREAFKPKRMARYAPNVVVVTYIGGPEASFRSAVERKLDIVPDKKVPSRYFVRYFIGPKALAAGETVESMVALLQGQPGVKFAEPDYEITPDQVPNDPQFSNQWALHNYGQLGGTPDADIDAVEAWSMVPAGPDVLVAVLDDGVEYTHPDLAGNIAINPNEIAGNGIDDDLNGYVDDVRGWDTADNDNNPAPGSASDSHGTHVAGTVAAVTNNAIGVAGTAKRVKVLPIRMYKGQSTWMTSLANGIDYSRIRGASVLNVSYSTDAFTMFLIEAIQRADSAGILYLNSSGNNSENMDAGRGRMKQYASNVMFVAASTQYDRIANFSNFGETTDIAAPGAGILSTVTGGGYAYYSGTSMATPVVAGAAAMLRAVYPSLTPAQVIQRLKMSADPKNSFLPYFPGGGRLNLANALENDTVRPGPPKSVRSLGRTSGTIALSFAASGDDGLVGQAAYYEVVSSRQPITSDNFDEATNRKIIPGGVDPGTTVQAHIPQLLPGQAFYVAVRSRDNVGNKSASVSVGPVHTLPALFTDGFEDPGWTGQAGKSWSRTAGSAQSGTYAWDDSPGSNYVDNENSSLTMNGTVTVDGLVALGFSAKHDLEANYDFLFVEYSLDGVNWTTIGQITGLSKGWRQYSALIPGSNVRTVKLRFRLRSDEIITGAGVMLDDVRIVRKVNIADYNMEGDSTGWSGEAPWQLSSVLSHSPTKAWNDSPSGNYLNNTSIKLQPFAPINLKNYADVQMSFWASFQLETGYDFLDVFFGIDAAEPVYIGSLTGVTSGWISMTLPIDATTSILPIFRLSTDTEVTADGARVDDVGLIGELLVKGVAPVSLQTLTLSGTTVPSGGTATGTVTLSGPAPAGGVVVQLSTSDASLTVSPDVIVPAGSSSASFDMTAAVVNAPRNVTVTAQFDGTKKTANIQVRAPKLLSATMSPSSIVGGTTQKTKLTVTLETAAPSGGINVTLVSSQPSLIVVPSTFKILEGQTTRTLFLGAPVVSVDTSVTVTAQWQGASKIASVQVKTHRPAQVTTSASSVAGGSGATLTGAVTLNGPAPTGGMTVTLASSNTDALVVPASIVIPQGNLGASFPITHKPVATNTAVTITATANSLSATSGTVTVVPHLPTSVKVSPTTVVGGSATAVTGTITINAPAAAGGYEVVLSSSLASAAKPQATVIIPAGATSANFSISHFAVASPQDVKIRGTARGKTVSVSLFVNP